MRDEVERFLTVGPLPASSRVVPLSRIEQLEEALGAIPEPLAQAEAEALAEMFGGDECFGLAWLLLHKIETAPQPVIQFEPAVDANEWKLLLWERASRGAPV